jgi:transcriptional regulator with XRE-family HTH domain
MIDAVRFGQKIRILRESVTSNRRAFARSLGSVNSASYLFQVERGSQLPAIAYCERIAKAASVPLRDLIDPRISVVLSADEFSKEAASHIRSITPRDRARIIEVLRALHIRNGK